jgi:predicted NAD/FAD-binding protein
MTRERVCIVGAGMAGMGCAWGLHQHTDRFDFELWERNDRIGGNAMTAEMPQADGSRIPFDVSVTAYIPTAYNHYVLLLEQYGVRSVPTRFSYCVRYGDDVYAHDYDSPLMRRLRPEIERFGRVIHDVNRLSFLAEPGSRLKSALNPFNYLTMGRLLDYHGFSYEFRYKVLKPLFVNFVLASSLFDMPASLFARYLDFFTVDRATPMVTWDGGTASLHRRMTEPFRDRIHLGRAVDRIERDDRSVIVRDRAGRAERFDHVVLACNANQGLVMLDRPTAMERLVLGRVRYESELHNHAIIHWDDSVLPKDDTRALETRSNYVEQYGARPDNYEITYIMHNQQPWAKRSDKPCLVTYNPQRPIDERKIIARTWFQHVIHDVFHLTFLTSAFQLVQGTRGLWHCGAHTTINSQEHTFISGLAVARQLGADYPFADPTARRWFDFWGRTMFGRRFRTVGTELPTTTKSTSRSW